MSSTGPASSSGAIEGVLAANQAATRSSIAYAVAGKAMSAQRAAGDTALALLDAATPKGAADGKGARLDTTA